MHDSNLLLPAHDLHNVFEGYVLCIQFIRGISTFASQKTAQFTYHSGPCPVVTWEDPIPPISFLPSFLSLWTQRPQAISSSSSARKWFDCCRSRTDGTTKSFRRRRRQEERWSPVSEQEKCYASTSTPGWLRTRKPQA